MANWYEVKVDLIHYLTDMEENMTPKIGIPVVDETAKGNFKNYENAIEEHGGEVCFLVRGEKSNEDFISEIDGLLLPGGGDIHPDNFDQEWHPTIKYVDEDRDDLELSLFEEAYKEDMPIFGICRGIQIMSVAMGGSLFQDIDSVYPKQALTHPAVDRKDSKHTIVIEPDNKLNDIIGERVVEVNSAHHQAVDEDNLGNGFVVTARSSDGIVEAVENPSKEFVIGVQYHPERMKSSPEFQEHRRKLFESFIQATIT